MAKEYKITNAFPATVSKEDKTPRTFESHGKTLQVWQVKVEGQDKWFQLNKIQGSVITPGDTIYGLFDTEEHNGKEYLKFVRQERKDGSHDVVQARDSSDNAGSVSAPSSAPLNNERLEYAIKMLEELTGRREVTGDETVEEPTTQEDDEDAPINLDDLNI